MGRTLQDEQIPIIALLEIPIYRDKSRVRPAATCKITEIDAWPQSQSLGRPMFSSVGSKYLDSITTK